MYRYYTEQNFTNIANAIRQKQGSTVQFTPPEMGPAIRNIVPDGIRNGVKTILYSGTSQPSSIFTTESMDVFDMIKITVKNDASNEINAYYLTSNNFYYDDSDDYYSTSTIVDDISFMITNSLAYELDDIVITFTDHSQMSIAYSGSNYISSIQGITYKGKSGIVLYDAPTDFVLKGNRTNVVTFESSYLVFFDKNDYKLEMNIDEMPKMDYGGDSDDFRLLGEESGSYSHLSDDVVNIICIELSSQQASLDYVEKFRMYGQFGNNLYVYFKEYTNDYASASTYEDFLVGDDITIIFKKNPEQILVYSGTNQTPVAWLDIAYLKTRNYFQYNRGNSPENSWSSSYRDFTGHDSNPYYMPCPLNSIIYNHDIKFKKFKLTTL